MGGIPARTPVDISTSDVHADPRLNRLVSTPADRHAFRRDDEVFGALLESVEKSKLSRPGKLFTMSILKRSVAPSGISIKNHRAAFPPRFVSFPYAARDNYFWFATVFAKARIAFGEPTPHSDFPNKRDHPSAVLFATDPESLIIAAFSSSVPDSCVPKRMVSAALQILLFAGRFTYQSRNISLPLLELLLKAMANSCAVTPAPITTSNEPNHPRQ